MVDTVIVALPREDDRVNKISSEKKPHMTLLYLGENLDMDSLPQVVQYLQHVAKTSLHRFGLSVDRRGTLGDRDADVLFFEDGWQTKNIQEVQHYLRADENIAAAYAQSKQYAKWTPHLTLGYPDTPANKLKDEEESRIYYVEFDRIAIWTGESEGPEFRLEAERYDYPDEVGWSELKVAQAMGASFLEYFMTPETLAHYGVPGMQWGKRKADSGTSNSGTSTSPRAEKKAAKAADKADAKFIAANGGARGYMKINNMLADRINPQIEALNAPYDKKLNGTHISNPANAALKKQYVSDYTKLLQKSLDEVAADINSTSTTGRVKLEVEVVDNGYPNINFRYRVSKVQHDDSEMYVEIIPTFNSLDLITGQKFKMVVPKEIMHSEEFADFVMSDEFDSLMHYGVPGMRWGYRKTEGPSGVTLKVVDGKRVKATGGKGETPSEDAKRTAEQRQKARKSSTDSLSNNELKQLVERMQLEANYDRLVKQQQGSDIVRKLLGDRKYRDQQVKNINSLTMPIRTTVGAGLGVGNTIRKTDLSGIGR